MDKDNSHSNMARVMQIRRNAERLIEGASKYNRDRKKPHSPSLPHHRTNGSRIRRFDELNSYHGARLGSPKLLK